MSVALSGCAQVPDAINPVQWYKGAANALTGYGSDSGNGGALVADTAHENYTAPVARTVTPSRPFVRAAVKPMAPESQTEAPPPPVAAQPPAPVAEKPLPAVSPAAAKAAQAKAAALKAAQEKAAAEQAAQAKAAALKAAEEKAAAEQAAQAKAAALKAAEEKAAAEKAVAERDAEMKAARQKAAREKAAEEKAAAAKAAIAAREAAQGRANPVPPPVSVAGAAVSAPPNPASLSGTQAVDAYYRQALAQSAPSAASANSLTEAGDRLGSSGGAPSGQRIHLVPPPGVAATSSGSAGLSSFRVAGVAFQGAGARLSGSDVRALARVARLYQQTGGTIRIVGRASQAAMAQGGGDPVALGIHRANQVARVLHRDGVPASRIQVGGAPGGQFADGGSEGARVYLMY